MFSEQSFKNADISMLLRNSKCQKQLPWRQIGEANGWSWSHRIYIRHVPAICTWCRDTYVHHLPLAFVSYLAMANTSLQLVSA